MFYWTYGQTCRYAINRNKCIFHNYFLINTLGSMSQIFHLGPSFYSIESRN